MASKKDYAVVSGKLQPKHRDYPERQAQPNARPVIDKGTAYKVVYLSKAPGVLKSDDLYKAVEKHKNLMIAELQRAGKHVTKVVKTVTGDGDVRLHATWEVLGAKGRKNE